MACTDILGGRCSGKNKGTLKCHFEVKSDHYHFSKAASSSVPCLDVDDLTMIDLDIFFYSKQEKVREPFFSTQTS